MATALEHSEIKEIFKQSLVEALYENKPMFEEIFTDVIEEIGLCEAIRQGRETSLVSSEDVFTILENKS